MEPPVDSGSELKKIFDAFDLDKSGSIDLKELKSVAAQLGKEISPEQLSSIVKKLDSNKDGKISYGEFEYWWQKGMQGKMMQLVYLRSKAMKLTSFVKRKASQLGINFEGHKGKEKPDKYSLKLSFGAEMENAIKFDLGVYIRGQKETQLRERIKKYVPDLTPNTFGIVFRLPSKNPAKAKAAMDHMLNSIITDQDLPLKIESVESNPFFRCKTVVTQNDLIVKIKLETQLENVVAPVSQPAQFVVEQIGKGFYAQADLHFALNAPVDKLLSDTIINNVLRGFNFSFDLEANNSALQKLRKLLQKNGIQSHPYLSLLALFRTAKFHLALKSPQHLSKFFKKLGVEDVIGSLPSLKDILEELTPIVKQEKDNLIMKLIYKLSRYAFQHVENDIELFVVAGPIGTAYLRAQGKNASKFHSIIFNEA